MGNWNISVRGVGVHHNGKKADGTPSVPEDADVMAREFVEKMKAAGHTITGAEITSGGATVFEGGAVDANGSKAG